MFQRNKIKTEEQVPDWIVNSIPGLWGSSVGSRDTQSKCLIWEDFSQKNAKKVLALKILCIFAKQT